MKMKEFGPRGRVPGAPLDPPLTNVHTGQRQGEGTGPIVSHCESPVT